MEIEELKSAWQKKNKNLDNKSNDYNVILLDHKSWFIRNRIAIEGLLCIILSLFLMVMLIIQNFNLENYSTIIIYTFWLIIAIYTLVKGIFTLLFFIKSCNLNTATSKFIQINLKNRLYLVYEKMIWLWFILPITIAILPFVVVNLMTIRENTILIYTITVGILYLIVLLVFSKSLWQKKRIILARIREINYK